MPRPATLSPSQFNRFVHQNWGLTDTQEEQLEKLYNRDKPLTDNMKQTVRDLEEKKTLRIWNDSAETYSIEIVHQLLGVPTDDFTSFAMQWGIDNEEFAINQYEEINFAQVERNIRKFHAEYEFVSGEADGLVGDDGIVEVKCPNSVNHLKNLMYGTQLKDYELQIQGYLWIFGREWCDFISYDPRFQEQKHKISIHTVERDQIMIDLIEERCIAFWNELVLPKLEMVQGVTV